MNIRGYDRNRHIPSFFCTPANFPDKCLREKRGFSNKVFLAPKYASFERFSKRLEINDL